MIPRVVYRIVDGDTERWFVPTMIGPTVIHGIEVTPANRVAPAARRVKHPLELFDGDGCPEGWERVETEVGT